MNVADPKESVQQFLWEMPLAYKVGLDSEEDLEKPPSYGVTRAYHVESFPTTYVVDAKGRIAFRGTGLKFDQLAATLRKLGVK